MRALQGLVSVLGRVLLCGIFLSSGVMHLVNYGPTLEATRGQGVPYPEVLLPGAIAFLLLGGVSVLIGFQARIGALLLAVFLGLAAYYFHNFWTLPESAPERMSQTAHFMKNVALMGAMLFIIANGSGAWSVDGKPKE